MPNLLIVANAPSDNTRKLRQAVYAGACCDAHERLQVQMLAPLEANAQQVLSANGVILGSTENFGAVSGLMKDFLERIYYPCLEKTEGLAVGVYIKGGQDGSGAKLGIERILRGLKWKYIQPTVVLKGKYRPEFAESCYELGRTMAAGLDANIF